MTILDTFLVGSVIGLVLAVGIGGGRLLKMIKVVERELNWDIEQKTGRYNRKLDILEDVVKKIADQTDLTITKEVKFEYWTYAYNPFVAPEYDTKVTVQPKTEKEKEIERHRKAIRELEEESEE